MFEPLIVPATLTTLRPDTNVTYDFAGMDFTAVNMTVAPAMDGEHVSDKALALVAVGFALDQVLVDCQCALALSWRRCSLGGEQLGSSQVQTLASTARPGKGINGSAALEAGQETMNDAASVYTEVGSKGVPNGLAIGTSLIAPRCMLVCKASATRMLPATVR